MIKIAIVLTLVGAILWLAGAASRSDWRAIAILAICWMLLFIQWSNLRDRLALNEKLDELQTRSKNDAACQKPSNEGLIDG